MRGKPLFVDLHLLLVDSFLPSFGIFRVSDPPGMQILQHCNLKGMLCCWNGTCHEVYVVRDVCVVLFLIFLCAYY